MLTIASMYILIAAMLSLTSAFSLKRSGRATQDTSLRSPLRLASTSASVEERIAGATNIVLYDGVCNFCNAWVDLLLQIDTVGKFSYAPLQGEVGMALLEKVGRDRSDISSVVLVKKQGTGSMGEYKGYIKSDAVVEVIKELDLPLLSPAGVIVATLLPKGFKNGMYDQVADNRYKLMGTRTTMERLNDEKNADRFLW